MRILLLTILLLGSLNKAEGISASHPLRPPLAYVHRVIGDLAQLQMNNFLVSDTWINGSIDPKNIEFFGLDSDASGVFTTPKGRVIKVAKNRSVSILVGIVQTHNILTRPVTIPGIYKWDGELIRSLRRGRNTSENEKIFSPFYNGGTMLFCYNEKAEGAAKFNPVYLIPDEWATFVLPAFKFQQSHKALFDETKVVANLKQLNALLDDKNPFNAVAAARLLAPQRGLDAPFISRTLSQSKDYTQAVFTYLVFKNAHPLRQVAIDEALGKVIDKAASSETLKWIALGLITAQNDDANSYFALKDRVKALLLKVDARQKALKSKTPDDDYVNELLVNSQIRQPPPVQAKAATPNVGF